MEAELKIVLDFLTQGLPINDLPTADAIFVFGSSNPLVAHHVARVYHAKRAPRIVFTGKYRHKERLLGYRSEAEFHAYVAQGIP